jgi:hypothetical protein
MEGDSPEVLAMRLELDAIVFKPCVFVAKDLAFDPDRDGTGTRPSSLKTAYVICFSTTFLKGIS